jgi:hypothetical protein
MSLLGLAGKERQCHVCGKIFIIYPDWVYRKGYGEGATVFCSYKCFREHEKKGKGSGLSRGDRIRLAMADGLTNKEIAALLGIDPRSVLYWTKKIEKEREHDEVLPQTKNQGIGERKHERKAESEAGISED